MTDKVIKRWKQKLKNMKKEDFIVLLLAGVLLLILSLPTEKGRTDSVSGTAQKNSGKEGGESTDFFGRETEKAVDGAAEAFEAGDLIDNASYSLDAYVDGLERRVEELVAGMEGAGKVRVMITVADMGTEIVERNLETVTSDLEETDNAGGNRRNRESEQRKEVIYRRDSDGNEIPYVVRRKLPEVVGVVVTAEGAGNTKVRENITQAVGVLFGLNEHRIRVIRMKS